MTATLTGPIGPDRLADRLRAPQLTNYAFAYSDPAYPYEPAPPPLVRLAWVLEDRRRAVAQDFWADWHALCRQVQRQRRCWQDRLYGGFALAHLRLQRFLLLVQPPRPVDKL